MKDLKSHKTVQQIAKKHRLDVSFIVNQLKMGEPIEHEHTKDHDLAMDIALQHLNEIPDYYTRLKKMEASAKKHHKKFKDVKEESDFRLGDLDSPVHIPAVHGVHVDHEKRYCTKCKRVELRSQCKYGPKYWDLFSLPEKLKEETMHEEERYCPLCDKRETRSECSYGGKVWDKVSIKDHEYSMARSELDTIMRAAKRLKNKVGRGEGNLEAWVQSKITKAADYIDTAADYVDSGEMNEGISFEVNPQDIRKSKRSSSIRNLATSGATQGEKEAAESKRKEPRMPRVKPGDTNIRNINAEFEPCLVDKILGELQEKKGLWYNIRKRRKKGLPRKKPGQKGYPETLDINVSEGIKQARKNVGASSCWKTKKLGNPKTKMKDGTEVPNCVSKESVTIQDANGNTFLEITDLIKPDPIQGFKSQVDEATRLQAQNGNVMDITLSWRGKYYGLKMFFPQIKIPNRSEINDELQKVYPGARVLHHSISEIQPGKPLIQPLGPQGGSTGHFGPSNKYVKPCGEQVEFNEDWQSSNRKDGVNGLSQKTVNIYKREHPGSKLQTAVTEKKPKGKRKKRRKSFCSRMKGMKRRLTSAKTARDPNSRINKALRRWRCR